LLPIRGWLNMKRKEEGMDFVLLLLLASLALLMNWDIMKHKGSSVLRLVSERTLRSKESNFILILEEFIMLREWSTIFDFSSS